MSQEERVYFLVMICSNGAGTAPGMHGLWCDWDECDVVLPLMSAKAVDFEVYGYLDPSHVGKTLTTVALHLPREHLLRVEARGFTREEAVAFHKEQQGGNSGKKVI